jgi:hypothetical protein
VHAAVGLLKPRVELEPEVELIREPPARLEVRLQVALQPLDAARAGTSRAPYRDLDGHEIGFDAVG